MKCLASAVAGEDYTETVSISLVFAAGSMDGDVTQCITVPILDDSLVEGNETFAVQLLSLNSGLNAAVVNDISTISIEDDEG